MSKEKNDATPTDDAPLTMDEVKAGIIEMENKNLPLFLQEHNTIHSIVIDSVVITSDMEPFSGYLSTTWDIDEKQDISTSEWANRGYKDKYIRKTKTVLIELDRLTIKKDGTFRWMTDWESAYRQVQDNERR